MSAVLSLTLVAAALSAGFSGFVDDDAGLRNAVLAAGGVLAGLGLAGLLLWRCVSRFGGITGDVLGALVEIATLGTLLVMAR